MAFNIGKISLGSSARKRYNHNLSFDNNTTFDFGSVQPLMCQYMMPNSDINVSYKQLVRLAPLVAPSFARVHLQNEVSFVPLADVVPYSDALLAQMAYTVGSKTYKPYMLPYTTNAMLVYLLLLSSEFTYWTKKSTSDHPDGWVPSDDLQEQIDMTAISNQLCTAVLGVTRSMIPELKVSNVVYSTDVSEVISFTSADQVVFFKDNTALTFRFNRVARRLRKIFIGLGYSLNISDNTQVSFAPILAFYKAWFDLYAVQRTQNWTNTKCFGIIKYLDDNYFYKFDATAFNSTFDLSTQVFSFIDELSQCWFTYPDDFVSVHRSSVNLQPVAYEFINGDSSSDNVIKTFDNSLGTSAPVHLPNGTPSNIFNVALQTLQRLTRFVNKDSIIGQRISDWLRVHYGADIANSVFSQTNHISSSRLDLQINDVFSTSDTASTESGDGEVLGAYAGKGLGFDKDGFRFHSNVTGYVFMLSAIVPESGYYQGNDTSLYGLDRFTLPSADFDALGMELTPKGAIVSDNNIIDFSDYDKLTDKAFGYVPRFSGFKVKKNIVNGDMSLRSSYDDLSPYYLDRTLLSNIITAENPYMTDSKTGKIYDAVEVTHMTQDLPIASEQWRYCARYPWLGNFNRIFSNVGSDVDYRKIETTSEAFSANMYPTNDNFICQVVFDVRVTNALRPISDSYDTFEESTDKSSIDVRPE